MKKFFALMLMIMVAVMNVNGQLIVDFRNAGKTAVLPGGAQMDITTLPGWTHYEAGYTIQENQVRYFNMLRRDFPDEYVKQIRLAAAQGITVPAGGVMMTGAGGGVYGVGEGGNLLSTYGSGMYASYDTTTGTVNVAGDPLMAAARTIDFIGSKLTSKKKKAAKEAAARYSANRQAAQQQATVQIVYVDSATGKVIRTETAQPQQAQQTRSAQPVKQQQASSSYYSGF